MDAEGAFAVFGPYMVAFAMVLARITGLMLIAPFYSAGNIPVMVKMGLVGTLTLVVMIQTGPMPLPGDFNAVRMIGLLVGEVLVGFLMGMVVAVLVSSVHFAGQLIGSQMGMTMANLVDPTTQQQASLVGTVLNAVTLLLFLAFDGHLMLLQALFESWEIVPLNKVWPNAEAILPELVRVGGRLFEIGLRLALPVVVATTFINIGLAIIARTVPQVNVFQLGFILTMLVGLTMLALSLPGLNVVVKNMLNEGLRSAVLMASATRGG